MRDTTPEFQSSVDEWYRRLTPGRACPPLHRNVRRGAAAGRIVAAPGLSERERKRRVTERFHGAEFADKVIPRWARGFDHCPNRDLRLKFAPCAR
jgi:hypothetical protein